MQHRRPFALALVPPHDLAIQQVSDRGGRKIVMKTEKAGIERLIACTQVQQARRVVFRGESEADAEILRGGGGLLYLRQGEISPG